MTITHLNSLFLLCLAMVNILFIIIKILFIYISLCFDGIFNCWLIIVINFFMILILRAWTKYEVFNEIYYCGCCLNVLGSTIGIFRLFYFLQIHFLVFFNNLFRFNVLTTFFSYWNRRNNDTSVWCRSHAHGHRHAKPTSINTKKVCGINQFTFQNYCCKVLSEVRA